MGWLQSGNSIGEKGAEALVPALVQMTALTTLDLVGDAAMFVGGRGSPGSGVMAMAMETDARMHFIWVGMCDDDVRGDCPLIFVHVVGCGVGDVHA